MDAFIGSYLELQNGERKTFSRLSSYDLPMCDKRDQQNVNIQWTETRKQKHPNCSDDDEDGVSCPFTPPPPRERLNYTRYQLELMRVIYDGVRYPNSVQKLIIAKRVGITRDQVKIWFQNRRRKDVLAKQKRPDEASANQADRTIGEQSEVETSVVPKLVLDSIVTEIIKYKNTEKNNKKRSKRKLDVDPCQDVISESSKRAKINYDMVNPPNRVTPTAFNGGDVNSYQIYGDNIGAFRSDSSSCALNKDTLNLHNTSNYSQYEENRRSPRCYQHGSRGAYNDGYYNNLTDGIDYRHTSRDSSPDSALSSMSSCSSLDSLPVLSDLLRNSPDSSYSKQQSPDICSDSAIISDNKCLPRTQYNYDINPIHTPKSIYPYQLTAESPILMSSFQPTDFSNPYNNSYWRAESPVQPISISTIPNPYYGMYHRASSPELTWHRSAYEHAHYTKL